MVAMIGRGFSPAAIAWLGSAAIEYSCHALGPERQTHTGLALILQPVAVGPDELGVLGPDGTHGSVEQMPEAERRRRGDAVVDARLRGLGEIDGPLGLVAGVDDLHRRVVRVRGQDASTLGDPSHPPGEAAGVVVRPDHVGRSDHGQSVIAVRLLRGLFAEHLQAAVGLAGDVLGRRVGEPDAGRRLSVIPGSSGSL